MDGNLVFSIDAEWIPVKKPHGGGKYGNRGAVFGNRLWLATVDSYRLGIICKSVFLGEPQLQAEPIQCAGKVTFEWFMAVIETDLIFQLFSFVLVFRIQPLQVPLHFTSLPVFSSSE